MMTTSAATGWSNRTDALLTVPRWAVIAAHVAALAPALASLWRLPLMFGISMGMDDAFMEEMMSTPFAARAAYLIGLGALAECLAFLTIGLVRPWGEIVPRWVPGLRGRTLPAWLVIMIATLGGLAATVLFTAMAFAWSGNFIGFDGWGVLMTVCYAPLLVWGPLVLAVTWAYWRRRRVLPS